jgi:type I restriction enzyme S subunit
VRNGWQTKKLGALCEIALGKTPARANKAFWDEKRETGNVWLSIADLLHAEDNVVVDSTEYVSDKGAAICKTVPKGTLLASFKLTLGRLAFAGRDLFTNEAIAALTVLNERELSREFLFYYLHFFDWDRATEGDVKVKGKTLNKAKLREMPVHFPQLREQRRIVRILHEVLQGIANAKANAEKNVRNAQAIFEGHLQSVLTRHDDDWVGTTIGAQVLLQRGFDITKHGQGEGDVPVVSSGGIKSFHDKSMVQAPGVVIGRKGTLGKVFFLEADFWPHDTTLWVKDFKGNDPRFVYYFFAGLNVKRLDSGTANPALNRNQVHPIHISWPPVTQQKTLAAMLDVLSSETRRLESVYGHKVAVLEELKKSLLHQAFTGQL